VHKVGVLGDTRANQRAIQEQTNSAGPGKHDGLLEKFSVIPHRRAVHHPMTEQYHREPAASIRLDENSRNSRSNWTRERVVKHLHADAALDGNGPLLRRLVTIAFESFGDRGMMFRPWQSIRHRGSSMFAVSWL